jgi:hypothetical protein
MKPPMSTDHHTPAASPTFANLTVPRRGTEPSYGVDVGFRLIL